ncbi:hypothetical protein HD554DRAFT_696629 [Boletus coccyginus]|nr:hypothetical protein HD554DRAFT_696629 [Boletus coccyginus]
MWSCPVTCLFDCVVCHNVVIFDCYDDDRMTALWWIKFIQHQSCGRVLKRLLAMIGSICCPTDGPSWLYRRCDRVRFTSSFPGRGRPWGVSEHVPLFLFSFSLLWDLWPPPPLATRRKSGGRQVVYASRIQNLRGRVSTCSNRYEHDVHACLLGRSDMSPMSAFALPPSTVSAATPTGLAHETRKKKAISQRPACQWSNVLRHNEHGQLIVGFVWYVRFECASFVP